MKNFLKITFTFSIALAFLLITGFFSRKKETPVVKINALKMNVFYAGVENPISISVSDLPNENLIVSMRGGSVKMVDGNNYSAKVDSGNFNPVAIIVSENLNGKIIVLDSLQFRVKRIQSPVAYVGDANSRSSEVSLKEIKSALGVFAKMEDCDFDGKFSVVSFTMSLVKKGEWIDLKASGPEFTPEMNYYLAGVEIGDRLFFHNFVVNGFDGSIRKIPGVSVTVK